MPAKSTEQRRWRDQQIKRVIILEGAANLFVLGLKVVVGISTGSLAILGDALHSLSDVANNVIAWFVVRLSQQPADREHPYGHRKFETLAVFGLAGLLTVLGFEVILRAAQRESAIIESSTWGVALMLVVLVVNVVLATWQRRWAKRLESDILLADASHTLSDVLITSVVIVGWLLSSSGHYWLDTVCAIGVAIVVLYLAYSLFRRALPALVDEFAIDPREISDGVQALQGVRSVSRVRSRWLGPHRAVDMVITVDPDLMIADSHAIADRVERFLQSEFNVDDTSIHVEPHH